PARAPRPRQPKNPAVASASTIATPATLSAGFRFTHFLSLPSGPVRRARMAKRLTKRRRASARSFAGWERRARALSRALLRNLFPARGGLRADRPGGGGGALCGIAPGGVGGPGPRAGAG